MGPSTQTLPQHRLTCGTLMAALFGSRWLYLNIAAALAVIVTFWWWQNDDLQSTESAATWIPDYYLTNATISQYDISGTLTSTISAQRFTHIREFGSTDMDQPRFNIYLNDNDSWFGRANEGLILDSGAQINLNGDTLLTNGPDLLRPLTLTSQSLRLFPNRNYAESEDQVRLQAKYSHLTGTGMRLTLNDQHLLLLSQVQSTHITPR